MSGALIPFCGLVVHSKTSPYRRIGFEAVAMSALYPC